MEKFIREGRMKLSTVLVIVTVSAVFIIPWVLLGIVIKNTERISRIEDEMVYQRSVDYDLQQNVIKLWGTVSKG